LLQLGEGIDELSVSGLPGERLTCTTVCVVPPPSLEYVRLEEVTLSSP